MSAAPPPVHQEHDRLQARPIVIVTLVSLVVIAVSLVVVVAMSSPVHRGESATAPVSIGGVYQTPIRGPALAAPKRRRADEALRSLGWVDRADGVAHIPIDDAKALIVERSAR